MSAGAALVVRSWPVGKRTCTLTVQRFKPGAVMHAAAEWSPDEPSRLSEAEWREYRAGRNHALSGIAEELGINVGVFEL